MQYKTFDKTLTESEDMPIGIPAWAVRWRPMSLHFLKMGAKEVWEARPPFQLGIPLASPIPMMSLMYGMACK